MGFNPAMVFNNGQKPKSAGILPTGWKCLAKVGPYGQGDLWFRLPMGQGSNHRGD